MCYVQHSQASVKNFKPFRMHDKSPFTAKIDSREAFKYHFILWQWIGIYPVNSWSSRLLYFITSLLTASLPIAMTIALFSLDQPKDILANLSINVTLIVCFLKYVNVLVRRQNILDVNDWLEMLDTRANSKNEQTCLRAAVRMGHNIFFLTLILFAGAVLLSELVSLFSGGERLMYTAWYPFDWHASLYNFSIAHLHQISALTMNLFQNVTSDSYPAVYVIVLTTHVRALNMRVSRIGTDPEKSFKENTNDLVQCIQDHQLLVQYFRTVQKVTSAAIFLQFFTTGLEACIVGVYVFFVKGNFFETMYLLVYFLCVILEIFLYCYYGNNLISESNALTEAIYSCNWMDQDRELKNILIMFMQSTQKDMTIIAGGYIVVSSPTFITVLKSSYSLFALLMQVT